MVIIPSAEELSVLIGVGDRVKPSSLGVMRRGISVFPWCKIPLSSALAAEATTGLISLHHVWIGRISGGGRCADF